jgi:SAM-dependent methyltransferase
MAAKGVEVDAIDLNPSMIRRARERHGHYIRNPRAVQGGEAPQQYEVAEGPAPLRFYEMDMLELDARFKPESFDAVACLGNTMVHLPGPAEIERFLREAAGLLKGGGDTGTTAETVGPHGSLILQILNYDYLLKQRPEALPPIETGKLRFERRYSYPAGTDGHITFSTRLHIKQSNQVYEDSVQLYPLGQAEIQLLLQRAGFKQPSFYGGFDASPLQPDSFPLIAVTGL